MGNIFSIFKKDKKKNKTSKKSTVVEYKITIQEPEEDFCEESKKEKNKTTSGGYCKEINRPPTPHWQKGRQRSVSNVSDKKNVFRYNTSIDKKF